MGQRFAIQAAVLQKHKPETEVILRMCGIANAITAIGRMFTISGDKDPDSAAAQRDRACSWILMASYLDESVVILNRRHNGLAWKLADAGAAVGISFPNTMPLATLKFLINKESQFIKSCNLIRDRFAFHMDKEPFMEWIDGRPPLEGVGVIAQLGEQNQDFVYDAAAFAVFDATEKLMVDDFGQTVALVVLAIPYLIEAMVRGFAQMKGLALSKTEKDGDAILFACEAGAYGS